MRKPFKVQSPRFKVFILLGLCLALCLSSLSWAQTKGPWEDVKLALEMGMQDLALNRLESYKPATQREKERTWLAMGYIYFKEKRYQQAQALLKKIPPSSIYYPAAQALSWNQEMEIEEVKGVEPPVSAPFKVFQKLLTQDPVAALDYLVLNSSLLLPGEEKKGVLGIYRLFFWRGDDDRVLALFRRFPFLAEKRETLWEAALAHYRRGEFRQALALLASLPPSARVHYWQATLLNILGRKGEAQRHLKKAAKGWGFYPFLARLHLGMAIPRYKPCPQARLDRKGLFHDLVDMGLEEVAQKILMDRLWTQKVSRDRALALFATINPSLALKLGMKGCLIYPHRNPVAGFCRLYHVDPSLVYAVMRQESMFDKKALSRSNAMGLMQVLPTTGDYISRKLSSTIFTPPMLYVPLFSIKYGVWYLAYLKKRFPTLPLVVAAYNAGPTAVTSWYKKWRMASAPEVAEFFPKAETRNYVKRVITYYLLYSFARDNGRP